MVRYSLCVSICFAAIGAVYGGEPGPVPAAPTVAAPVATVANAAVSKCTATAPVVEAKRATGISGRKRIEALLASPANLDFGGRETITVGELLAKLREQHQLSIRFDVPTLAGMYGQKSDETASWWHMKSLPTDSVVTLPQPLAAAIAERAGTFLARPANAPETSAPAVGVPCPPSAAPAAATYGTAPSRYPSTSAPSPYPSTSAPAAYGGSGYSASPGYGPGAPSAAPASETTAPAAPPAPPAASPNAPASPASPSSPPVPANNTTTTAAASNARTAAFVEAPPAAAATQSVVTKPYPTTAAPPLVALPAAAAAPVPQVTPASASGSSPVPQDVPAAAPPAQTEPYSAYHESAPQKLLDNLLNCEIDIRTIDLKTVSVATALRHALDSLPAVNVLGEGNGSPIMVSNCALIDYLVEADGVQITTRLKALAYKETRVYSLKNLKGVTPEQAATVIRQSIRPWSWRSRIDELGDQLRGNSTTKALGAVIKPYAQQAAAESGLEVNLSAAAGAKPDEKESTPNKKPGEMSDAEQAAMFGNAIVNCVVTYMHSMLTVLEVVHYADPPTGSIQTLPGKLIITQSQAAHREIAELLEQLSEE